MFDHVTLCDCEEYVCAVNTEFTLKYLTVLTEVLRHTSMGIY